MDEDTVTDNRAEQQFELTVRGETAFLADERTPGILTLMHTEVPPALGGHHRGEKLVKAALEAARAEGLRLLLSAHLQRYFSESIRIFRDPRS